MAQWVKDPVITAAVLVTALWNRFYPWPRNFHMLQVWPKNKIKNLNVTGKNNGASYFRLTLFSCQCPVLQVTENAASTKGLRLTNVEPE